MPYGPILIVDDEPGNLSALRQVLGADYRLVFARSGAEALAAAAKHAPALILLDIGMPDMTGYEVARAIRETDWGRTTHLIAITGWGQAEDKARASAAGFDQHLTKPVDPEKVEELLRDWVNGDATA